MSSKSALRDLNCTPIAARLRSRTKNGNNQKQVVLGNPSLQGANDENHALNLNQPTRSKKSEKRKANPTKASSSSASCKPISAASSSAPSSASTLIINEAATAQVLSVQVSNADPAPSGPVEATAEVPGQEIEYILSEDLKPLQDPEHVFSGLLKRLDSKEWLTVWEGLIQVRQLSIFNSSLMLPFLNDVISLVIKAMKNPRSALCKTSIMVCSDLFKAYTDEILEALDPLLLQLMLKASQDKKFVCEEAERALLGMTTWISPAGLLQKLLPYATHRHPRVRAKTVFCISNTISKLGNQEMMDFGIEEIIKIAATQLNDQLPESREAARNVILFLQAQYKQFYSSATTHTDTAEDVWEQLCVSKLSAMTAQAVLRVSCCVS